MPHPLLYEINTRCWLCELSAAAGKPVRLDEVPESELVRWRALGFTHVWLMGVWSGGPRSRSEALANTDLQKVYSSALPDWQESDVAGSPYAIADYHVNPEMGGDTALGSFRRKLQAQGLKLILDFIPNHLGLDHPWLTERSELFVQAEPKAPGSFSHATAAGPRWIAHGKDPYFSPWTDTAQLDYRRPATHAAMTGLLQSVARQCDGVRCDMAMLLLNDVFEKTWERFPVSEARPESEFWSAAIAEVKRQLPEFLFLAEAYWGTEPRLQALGFDFTYDKTLYDRLVARDTTGVQQHLFGATPAALARAAYFLENHDEPRIASLLPLAEHRPAALLTLSLPGLRLLHEGQLEGAKTRTPVQLVRRPAEPKSAEIQKLYEGLLTALANSAVGKGRGQLLRTREAWPGNPTAGKLFVLQWQVQAPNFDLAIVNLAPHRSQCYAALEVPDLAEHNWTMHDQLGQEHYERWGQDLQKQGLYLDLPPHGAQLFHFAVQQ